LISSMIVAFSGFLITSIAFFARVPSSVPDDERVHQNDERDPDQVAVGSLCCLANPFRIDSSCLTELPRRRLAVLDELLAADDADLGQAKTLRRTPSRRHDCVLGGLVGTQVQLGLDAWAAAALSFSSSWSRSAPTRHSSRPGLRVDVDFHDLRWNGAGRIAGWQIEIDRVQLDRKA